MCARTPHGGTLRTVEHTELERRGVRDQTGVSAQGVDLPDDLAFGDSTHSRVATHLRQTIEIRCKKQDGRTHAGGSHSCLAAGMSASDYNDIEVAVHTFGRWDR